MMSELGIGISRGSEEVAPHESGVGAAVRYHHEYVRYIHHTSSVFIACRLVPLLCTSYMVTRVRHAQLLLAIALVKTCY